MISTNVPVLVGPILHKWPHALDAISKGVGAGYISLYVKLSGLLVIRINKPGVSMNVGWCREDGQVMQCPAVSHYDCGLGEFFQLYEDDQGDLLLGEEILVKEFPYRILSVESSLNNLDLFVELENVVRLDCSMLVLSKFDYDQWVEPYCLAMAAERRNMNEWVDGRREKIDDIRKAIREALLTTLSQNLVKAMPSGKLTKSVLSDVLGEALEFPTVTAGTTKIYLSDRKKGKDIPEIFDVALAVVKLNEIQIPRSRNRNKFEAELAEQLSVVQPKVAEALQKFF